MKIYVVERNNPSEWLEPQVYTDGNKAVEDIKKEYHEQMQELGVEENDPDNGYGVAWCDWSIDEKNCSGEALIDRDSDGDRWEWRITEHEISETEKESTWASETWIDDDLINALEFRCIEPTEKNVSKLREACKGMFDDKSDRMEMIDDRVCELFSLF